MRRPPTTVRVMLLVILLSLVPAGLWSNPKRTNNPDTTARAAITFRFSDRRDDFATDGTPFPIAYGRQPAMPPVIAAAPVVAAKRSLKRLGWGLPPWHALLGLGSWDAFTFAGPQTQRFLRLSPQQKIHLLGRRDGIDIDPQHFRWLAITWAVERAPQGASMQRYRRIDRSLVLQAALGTETFRHGVPRTLALFWGIDAAIGYDYTGVYDPQNRRTILDKNPQVRFICLRNQHGGYGLFTDFVDLLAVYTSLKARLQWPDQMPHIRALGIETSNKHTGSQTIAQLHQVRFLSQRPAANDWEILLTTVAPAGKPSFQ